MDKNIFNDTGYTGNFDFAELLSKYANMDKKPSHEDVYDWKKAYLDCKSDFDAYRKRTENARNMEKANLTREIINGFLDVVEHILFTFKAKNSIGSYSKEDELILNKLSSFLKGYNVYPMKDPVGSMFDEKYHEAVINDDSGLFKSGTITGLISHGFMIGDEVLRYAKVAVAS